MNGKQKQSPAAQSSADRRPTILVVEDEVLVRAAVAAQLRDAGFTVLEAAKSAEAVRIVRVDRSIAIVFTDVDMSGAMDGVAHAHFSRTGPATSWQVYPHFKCRKRERAAVQGPFESRCTNSSQITVVYEDVSRNLDVIVIFTADTKNEHLSIKMESILLASRYESAYYCARDAETCGALKGVFER